MHHIYYMFSFLFILSPVWSPAFPYHVTPTNWGIWGTCFLLRHAKTTSHIFTYLFFIAGSITHAEESAIYPFLTGTHGWLVIDRTMPSLSPSEQNHGPPQMADLNLWSPKHRQFPVSKLIKCISNFVFWRWQLSQKMPIILELPVIPYLMLD